MRHFPEQNAGLNGICPYFTRFPLHVPLERMRTALPGQWVLDPFCGCGTTLFAARILGMHAVGVDSNCTAVVIARAKTQQVTARAIIERAAHILTGMQNVSVPGGLFWERCYTRQTLQALCQFREHFINNGDSAVDTTLCALLLGMLHGANNANAQYCFSNLLPADFAPHPDEAVRVWKRRNLKPPPCDVPAMISRRAHALLLSQPDATRGGVHEADSRRLKLEEQGYCFDWIVTSPPYYGMGSYAGDQWLRRWLMGGPPLPQPDAHGQISHQTAAAYVADLALVWRRVAAACRPGAKLIARVGDVPGAAGPPAVVLLKRSLCQADAGWKVRTCRTVRGASCRPASRAVFTAPAPWPENETEVFVHFVP